MSGLFYHTMQDGLGNLLFGVTGTMRLAGTSTLATVYGDEALTVLVPNPMTNHPSFASFKCFLPAGDYDFYMAKAGYAFETITGIQGLGTMAQQDASYVAIAGGNAALTDLTVTGSTSLNTLVATGSTSLNGLTVTAPSSLNGLTVTAPSSLNGLTVTGSTSLNTLVATGSTSLNGLTVTAPSSLNGLTVTGATSLNGLTVTGTAQAATFAIPNTPGDVMNGIFSLLEAAGGSARFFLRHNADAPSYLGGALTVVGATAVHDLTATGASALNGLTVSGASALNSLTVTGASSVLGLAVAGPATFGDTTTFTLQSRFNNTVGIQVAPSAAVGLTLVYNRATQYGMWLQPTTDTGNGAIVFTNAAATAVGAISTSSTTTTYATTSDARLKHAISPLTGALDVVRRLRPVAFLWKADGSPGRGFVASEVQEVIPDGVITGEKDAVEADGSLRPQMIDYSKLVPYLTAAVKELAQQVEALTARLAAAGA